MSRALKLLTAMLLALAVFGAACGGSDDADETADDSSASASADAAEDSSDDAADDAAADDAAADDEGGETKAAFVMVAPIGDAGWNFMHNEGRLGAEAATGVETAFVEAIPEGGPEFDNAVQQFIDDGFNVIITTSFGYMDATERFANENPDVVFEHVSGFKMNDTNFGNTFGRMYQPRYIAGMAAGAATESDRIGYVAAFPIPEVIRGINAFALGVARTNPDAVVEVAWTSTWFDPGLEGNAAQALIDSGADVLTMHQDSTATGQAISDAGGTFIGYHSDMSAQVPAYLTAPIWNWTPRYADIIESAAAGNFVPEAYWGSMADGVVDITIPDSSSVAGEMQEVKDQILAGDFDVFDQGTITDQDGTVIIEDGVIQAELLNPFDDSVVVAAPGDALNDGVLLNMNFFVSNIDGSVTG
ncbi:MAG: BMP family ABC transporter substrate-binding protein [Actinomycetota bacterium]